MFGLPIGTLLSIASGLLTFANYVMSAAQSQRDFTAGEKNQIAKGLAETAKTAGILKEVEEEFARMTDEQIIARVEKEGDFRD